MITMREKRKQLGDLLECARLQRGITFRGLAQAAGMKHSYLALIQRGERGVGPEVAGRLAAALEMPGEERQHFLDLAAQSTGSNSRAAKHSHTQSILGHILETYLRVNRVDARSITSCASIEVGVPFGGVSRRLWTVCLRGAKSGPLKQSVQQHLRQSKRANLLVIFLPGNKQAVVDADLTCFAGK